MGNTVCEPAQAAHLAAIARDICPFPSYEPSPHLFNMILLNSSQHLAEHYAAVQASLTAQQLEGFTQSLRTTVGRKGKVTHGSVGVVALSLALLFDTLAGKMKGQCVPEEGLIPGLFFKHPTGQQLPYMNTLSEYLRLVPHIANNPTKMREESERYFRQMLTEQIADQNKLMRKGERPEDGPSDITMLNVFVSNLVIQGLYDHLVSLTNTTVVAEIVKSVMSVSMHEINQRLSDFIPFDFSLNCDAVEASKEFLAKIQASGDETLKAFDSCASNSVEISPPMTWIYYIAFLSLMDVANSARMYQPPMEKDIDKKMEDFDLKGNALGKWSD